MRAFGEHNINFFNEFYKFNLHKFNILFITYPRKRTLNCKKDDFSPTNLLYNDTVCIAQINDIMSK